METGELGCEIRAVRPKGLVHQLRRQGRIPAILYGPTTAPTALSVDRLQLGATMSMAARVRLIRLKSSAPELDGRHVIFREVQRAPVSGEILHADLYEVDLNRAIRVEVPLKFVGLAAGVSEGGILQPLVRVVEVECLPLEIPEAIEVDVAALGIHDVIHVSGVKFAANVKPIFDSDYAVVSVLPPTVAEAPAAAAAAAAEAVPAEGAAPEAGAPAAAAPAAEGAKEGAAAAAPAAGPKKAEPAAKK
ncbi:MAG TPA: 50S ribosomal protein L25 [Candidatus Binataceae bacterium]|nr:50S ribosomal protein L25 [Candidatus Binataceae bacterium]